MCHVERGERRGINTQETLKEKDAVAAKKRDRIKKEAIP